MPYITSIKHVGKMPVYNMSVDKYSNFKLSNGIIVHNCDMVRYYAVSRTLKTEPILEPEYPDDDQIEDYDDYMTGGEMSMSYIAY